MALAYLLAAVRTVSGMRLDCGTKAFSLPNGTMIASSFNKELTRELFTFMGLEMAANKVDCLLGME